MKAATVWKECRKRCKTSFGNSIEHTQKKRKHAHILAQKYRVSEVHTAQRIDVIDRRGHQAQTASDYSVLNEHVSSRDSTARHMHPPFGAVAHFRHLAVRRE